MPPIAKKHRSSVPVAKSPQHAPVPWHWAPLASATLFTVLAVGAAWIETPTVDEFAHMPAGMAHWRYGQLRAYPHNPPLGKMWVAMPVAFDSSVRLEKYPAVDGGWAPWDFGAAFQHANSERYLSLIFRARLMVVPLVLLTAWMIYRWATGLFGPYPAAIAASLFLLAPTVLAHGHLATVDVASMTTIFAAIICLRWALQASNWRRDAVAGAALGLALLVKFSALFLLFVTPAIILAATWLKTPRDAVRVALWRLAIYAFACWLTVNLLMGFRGTFDLLRSHRFESRAMQRIDNWLPTSMPSLLPRDYLFGLDVLQWELERESFPGYFAGEWSRSGWKMYYPAAFAMKETELVVLLAAAGLIAIWFARIDIWEVFLLLFPPAAFLFIVISLNTLSLGIRYILPAFPFVFVMFGAVFLLIERWFERKSVARGVPASRDRRLWIGAAFVAYSAGLMIAVFPSYLAYFSAFVGGSANGPNWLLDSNYDWGQDLYRVARYTRANATDRLYMMYFGQVDQSVYGIDVPKVPKHPEAGTYAVSANFWKGAQYGDQSPPPWIRQLEPTDRLGSIMLFDVRPPTDPQAASPTELHNWGIALLERGEFAPAAQFLRSSLERDPHRARTRAAYARALEGAGQFPQAMQEYRRVLQESPDDEMVLNNLAWHLATSADPALRIPSEAVRLAQRACELTRRQNLDFLDTLATALAANGQIDEARQVAREGLDKAQTAGQEANAAQFRQFLQRLP